MYPGKVRRVTEEAFFWGDLSFLRSPGRWVVLFLKDMHLNDHVVKNIKVCCVTLSADKHFLGTALSGHLKTLLPLQTGVVPFQLSAFTVLLWYKERQSKTLNRNEHEEKI